MMRRSFTFTSVAAVLMTVMPYVSIVSGQDHVDGPLGEFNSKATIEALSDREFLSPDPSTLPAANDFVSPNAYSSVIQTPSGEMVELFNPVAGNARVENNQTSVPSSSDWITEDGRINLQQVGPEGQLWAPEGTGAAGWTDGPIGLQVGVDWLFFTRGVNDGAVFAFNDSGETFSNSDIDLDTESTARYRLGIASEYGTGFEFVGYDFDEFSGSLELTGEGVTPIFFGGAPAEPVDSYTTSYRSQIESYELNVWSRRSRAVRIGCGLRYFSIEENYDITEGTDNGGTAAGNTGSQNATFAGFFSSTKNDLFGAQINLELFRHLTQSTALEGGVKGMLLNNDAEIDVNTGNIDQTGDDSFVTGGVNFYGGVNYRPFRGLNLRAGYEGVFIGSVASGSAQSENNSVFADAVSPVGEGLFYGGGYAGATVTF